MSLRLTKFQKQLCNTLQDGLPICPRPFDDIAKFLNTDEQTVLQQTSELKKTGVIRRIGALINYRALGIISTLVAAHIPKRLLPTVTESVSSLPSVSHNYLRSHRYNLWFTLQASRAEEIELTLSSLSERFGLKFHSLPAKRVFKLDARFDAVSEVGVALKDVVKIPESKIVKMDKNQKLILSKLQDGLEPVARPFDFLCGKGLKSKDALRITQELIDKGVVRRIGAVVDHRRLGFAANVLFAGEVPQDRIIEAGKRLARFGAVTHCYERKTFEGWPYNLFAMIHGRGMGEIQHVIDRFTRAKGIESFELLPSLAELKKQPVKHRFF